jgi:hypothetical protein
MMLWQRARRRAAAVRAQREGGFALVFVMCVITFVTMLVTSMMVVTSGSIVPSVAGAYDQAADQAAQGGLQAFIAYVDGNCTGANSTVSACNLPSNASGVTNISLPNASAGYTATYSWVAQKDPGNRYFRVKSTGRVSQGGVSATRTVIGDIVGGANANLLNYGLVTGFESQSSSDVLSQWPQRQIALDSTAQNNTDVPVTGSCGSGAAQNYTCINWSGASPGTAPGKVAVCNATFDVNGGRSNNLPPNAPNPYVDWTEQGLNGDNYTHFAPCQTSWGTLTKLIAPANPDNGKGGYYTNDAILVSNSYPGGTGPLFDQPVTTNWAYTSADAGLCGTTPGLNYRSFNLACAGYPVEVGGTPTGQYPVVSMPPGPQLPTGAPVLNPASTCAYAGPTRVVLNGTTATVTSPQTTSAWVAGTGAAYPAQCYTGVGAQGMANQTISLVTPVIIRIVTAVDNGTPPNVTPAIAHGSSGWPTTGQQLGTSNSTPSTANSVFYISSPAATSADTATAAAADACTSTATYTGAAASANCQWADTSTTQGSGFTADGTGWTKYSTGTTCGTDATDKLTFECEYHGGTAATGQYALYRTAVKNALASASASYGASSSLSLSCSATSVTPTTASASQLACLMQDLVKKANTSSRSAGYTSPSTGDHQYVVVPGTATTTTTNNVTVGTAPSTNVTDPFFSTTSGTASTETVTVKKTTFTVGRQVYKCYGIVSLGLCQVTLGGPLLGNQWGDGSTTANGYVPQFQVTITQTTYSNFVQGATAVSSFPSMSDVTQYQMGTINPNGQGQTSTFGQSGPGDLYIQGTATNTMAIVASDDVIVTNALAPTDPTTAALEVVSRNDVRVYHPVKCAASDTTLIGYTSPGFCPNDITGLYYGVQTTGRPDQQYVNMRPDLANLTITAVIFALGNSASHITCPQPPSGGGVCGGEFTADNFGRGAPLGQLTEIGTIGMQHHAPVGQEWEIPDTTGQTSRPYSGYQMAQQYLNLQALIQAVSDVNNVIPLTSAVSYLWRIVSISSAANS